VPGGRAERGWRGLKVKRSTRRMSPWISAWTGYERMKKRCQFKSDD
jgi:hypothetical protein